MQIVYGSVEQFQVIEVRERTEPKPAMTCMYLQESDTLSCHFGVKGGCVLTESLNYFHTITGFPPDLLHDLLESIVPLELSLCVKKMIQLTYFTLEYLNHKIIPFQYQHTNEVDRPQPLPKMLLSLSRGTIGGNGHENDTLLPLLPLLVGSVILEGDKVWAVLMELNEVAELALCPSFTNETLDYFVCKISVHKQALLELFPELRLCPKHHYVEHLHARKETAMTSLVLHSSGFLQGM